MSVVVGLVTIFGGIFALAAFIVLVMWLWEKEIAQFLIGLVCAGILFYALLQAAGDVGGIYPQLPRSNEMSHTIQTANEAFFRLGYSSDTIYFFDFDGVLADQEEEKVFRLPEIENERGHLEAIGKLNGIDASLYHSTRYLRHLIYQANALGEPIKPHLEAVEFARHLTATRQPYFIVTARSGFWAVQRMIQFCQQWELFPQETFCLGRMSKAILLEHLRDEWPERPFVYFEDSQHHIQAAKNLGDPNLEIVEVEWPKCMEGAKRARRERLGF